MSTVENPVAAENFAELAELIGLTCAGLDMREHFPKDVPAGRGCGIFLGIGGGVHFPVGGGKLAGVAPSRLHLMGDFKYLGYERSAELEIELTGPGRARLRLPGVSPQWMNAAAWKESGNLFYKVNGPGPIQNARIKQIFGNAGLISGAYVEFHITLQDGGYYEVKYWFHKS